MVLLVGRYGDDGRHIKSRKGVNAQVDCGEEDENGYPLTVKVAIKRLRPFLKADCWHVSILLSLGRGHLM